MRRQPEMLGHVLGTPLIVFALLYFGGYQKSIEAAVSSGTNVVVAILIGGAYLLTIAATQMIGKEIKMLWLLQCQPRPLADILRSKARVWGVIAIGISLPFVAGALFKMPDETAAILAGVPFLVTSLWWLAELTFGLTALGASVTSEQTVRFRKSAMLLPALILADASLALYSQSWWQQLGVLAILIVLNAAVRQRQLAELAWLSEPVETPPKKLYAMHGLLAFMGFDALMGFIKAILIQNSELSPVAIASIGYCVSAIVISVICWFWLRSNRFSVQPRLPRGPVLRPVVLGLTASCAVGLVVTLVLRFTQVGSQLPALASSDAARSGVYDKWFLLVLWVVAAPLFEEWIFRGFLYRTLRRSWSVALSVAVTAVLFATLHPVAGCVALLTLGTTTALVAEKTGRLWPSILVHSGYNLMVWLLVLA